MAAKSRKSPELVSVSSSSASPAESAHVAPFPSLSYADLASIGRDNVEAAVKANAALSAGIEAIGQEVMVCARAALKTASETAHGLLSARTFEDIVRLQTELAKRSFDGFVSGSVKLSELGVTAASEALAPWEGRVGAVMAHFAYPQPAKSTAA